LVGYLGRTDSGKLVTVMGSEELLGNICDVRVIKFSYILLEGKAVLRRRVRDFFSLFARESIPYEGSGYL